MLATAHSAPARIITLKITRVESPTFEGRSFGNEEDVQAYVTKAENSSIGK